MSFTRWRSLVDGAEIDVGSDIPDSVGTQYDAADVSGTIQTWPDAVGDRDITGGDPEVVDDELNGEPVVSFETDDLLSLDSSDWPDIDPPFTVIAVVSDMPQDSDNVSVFGEQDGDDNNVRIAWRNDSWTISIDGDDIDGSVTDTPVILTGVWSENGGLWENGDRTVDTDTAETMESFEMNSIRDGDLWNNELEIAKLNIYPDDDLHETGDLADEEQRLADRFGISLE